MSQYLKMYVFLVKKVCFLIFLINFLVSNISSDIIVTNNEKCTEMAKYYITEFNVTVPELAIIVSVCEGIVNPQDAGLGGGFLAVLYNGQCGKSLFLDSRERAPMEYNIYSRRKHAKVGVPSMLKGYEYLYSTHVCGVRPALPWHKLFTENIKLAEGGWTKTKTTDRVMHRLNTIDHNLDLNYVTNKIRNPTLGATLRKIALEGPSSSLYRSNGDLHNIVVDDMREAQTFVQSADLLTYNVVAGLPLERTCLNYKILTTATPGSGATFILGCKIVEAAYDRLKNLSYEKRLLFMYHTLRYMYSLKPYLLSPNISLDLVFANSQIIANHILETLEQPWQQKPIQKFGYYDLNMNLVRHKRESGTTNIVIRRGNYSITMTSTINWSWGSKLYSKRLGIFYNNQLRDFDAVGTPNAPGPNKTPQSAISTVIFRNDDDEPVFQIGSSGGSKIIGSIFNTFYNYFVNNMTLVEANKAARCFPRYSGVTETVYCEEEVSDDVKVMFNRLNVNADFSSEIGYAAVTAGSTVRCVPEGSFDKRRGGDTYLSVNTVKEAVCGLKSLHETLKALFVKFSDETE